MEKKKSQKLKDTQPKESQKLNDTQPKESQKLKDSQPKSRKLKDTQPKESKKIEINRIERLRAYKKVFEELLSRFGANVTFRSPERFRKSRKKKS
jgi:hypothetical protein